ncbi:MAG: MotA/TolQ/ExbB proton channel family protein [bacterium]
MGFSWTEMVGHMGVPAIAVALVLALMGMGSLTVFFERLLTARRSSKASEAFAAKVGADLHAGRLKLVLDEAKKVAKESHLARVVKAAIEAYAHAHHTADVSGLSAVDLTRRHMGRYMEEVGGDLRRGLALLATVGSVAPFVGLLGTVLGIISSFQGIASAGSGGLTAVSAGISEALIETAFGLAVAIPSVLGFNFHNERVVKEEMLLNNAVGELLDRMEDWREAEVSGIAVPTVFSPGAQVATPKIAPARAAVGSA